MNRGPRCSPLAYAPLSCRVPEALHVCMGAFPPPRVSASLSSSAICLAFSLQPRYLLVSSYYEGMVPSPDTGILVVTRSFRQEGCDEL